MNFKFGFELEGFYRTVGEIQLPPPQYPVDGFPGLCEVRSSGGKSLEEAYFELLNEFRKYPFDKDTVSTVFAPDQKRKIRGRQNIKNAVDIQNIYGKEPKELGSKTLASFQICISNQLSGPSERVADNRLIRESARYGIFDFVPVIRSLDKEFALEIKEANRQPGFYALKDNTRIEYRSLPNSLFETDLNKITTLLGRIQKAIEV